MNSVPESLEQFDFGAIGIVAIRDGDFACGFIDLPDA
jgi:hypothetical protein